MAPVSSSPAVATRLVEQQPVKRNVIEFNTKQGVVVSGGQKNSIRGNSIYANTLIGIDLGNDGPHSVQPAENRERFESIAALSDHLLRNLDRVGVDDFPWRHHYVTGDVYPRLLFQPPPRPQRLRPGQELHRFVRTSSSVRPATQLSASRSTAPPTNDTALTVTATDSVGNTSEFSAAAPLSLIASSSPDNTSTTLSSSLNPSKFGQSVTITATVTDTVHGSNTPSAASSI